MWLKCTVPRLTIHPNSANLKIWSRARGLYFARCFTKKSAMMRLASIDSGSADWYQKA